MISCIAFEAVAERISSNWAKGDAWLIETGDKATDELKHGFSLTVSDGLSPPDQEKGSRGEMVRPICVSNEKTGISFQG
ncbi:hypothetical protein [Methyloglobulus morosus]|uniref:hypothetical protein n=1 Tax=Methyloglobulus morosus TaxID=1410681 RepID=UPI00042343F3|nr:hypothetical protein [Methyloglobulus morosus]